MNDVAKKQSLDYLMIAAAHHESAHTLIYLYNLIKVFNVSISSDREMIKFTGGLAEYLLILDYDCIEDIDLRNKLLTSELMGLYSGLLGEKAYYHDICGSQRFPTHLSAGASGDIMEASNLIRKYDLASPGKNTTILKKQIEKKVKSVLLEYWADVKIIAHALYKYKSLSFEDLKNLLCKKNKNKVFWKTRFKDIDILHHDTIQLSEKDIKKKLF